MTRDDVVLVGVDGSAASLHALDWAAAQARDARLGRPAGLQLLAPSFTAASLDGGYAALDDTAIQEGAKAVLAEATDARLVDGRPGDGQGAHRRRRGRPGRHVARGPARGRRHARPRRVRRPAAGHRLVGPARARVLPDRRRPAAGGRQDRFPTTPRSPRRGPCSGSSSASTGRRRPSTRCGTRSARRRRGGAELTAVAGVPVGSHVGRPRVAARRGGPRAGAARRHRRAATSSSTARSPSTPA